MTRVTRVMLVFTLSLSSWPALAQQTTGSIAGRVVDASEAGISAVTVTASNADTGLMRETVTNVSGLYRLKALPVGR